MPDPVQVKAAADYVDQLLKYADAIVGVAFLQSLAFCYKLGDEDFAKKISQVPGAVLSANLVACAFYSVIIYFLFDIQKSLSNSDLSSLAHAKFEVQLGRYLIIATATALSVFAFLFTRFKHGEGKPAC